jgi:hypothetical protein
MTVYVLFRRCIDDLEDWAVFESFSRSDLPQECPPPFLQYEHDIFSLRTKLPYFSAEARRD